MARWKKNKYNNKRVYDCDHCDMYHVESKPEKCVCGRSDYTVFDSWKEFTRWAELKLQERAGMIKSLKRQVRMPIYINGLKVFSYVADFDYYTHDDQHIVEDSKGMETDTFRLKKKCVEAYYGLHIKIT